jgi:hypothetical protein
MKTLSTIIMGFAILAGLILAITPFVADKFFPVPENVVRLAKKDAAVMALQQWFKSPDALFTDVQAINKSTVNDKTSWFSFSVGRKPVEKYILAKKLQQLALTSDVFESVFFSNKPPASWWQPEAIDQQTYFTGEDQGRFVSLIYNPDSKRGVMVTSNKSSR